MTSDQIRRQFIDFFVQKHGHTFVPSSPVVPQDDPTLLFTNAGMNQFKPIFLGTAKPPYTRAANTQKCIRAGGKHNDLDDVGRSRRHHTFFEMLGNWSFGDYFKQGAIEMAWELLTQVWNLDPSRLHVSCFEGDEKNGVPRDTEAADIWKQVAHLPDDHIHYFGKDNFWEMGDTGPCGPCTEIYYDRTPDKTGGPQVNGEDPRVMEIWNLVFIQYNRSWKGGGEALVREFDRVRGEPEPAENADQARDRIRHERFGTDSRLQWINQHTNLEVLPAQHVDTGMGFERITQVLQNVDSNYSIDLWHPFWAKLNDLSGHTYSGKFPPTNSVDAAAEAADEGLRKDIAFRVIADHARCLTFALTDGAVPSNEGRGYVLRRILRRAVRFGRQQLGINEPFLYSIVPVVVDAMADAFPELKKSPLKVAQLIRDEEVSFGKTLGRGIQLFEEAVRRVGGPSTLVHKASPQALRAGARRAVVFDTNAYRDLVRTSFPAGNWSAERLVDLEKRRSHVAFANPYVVMELASHLSDPSDPSFAQCRSALALLAKHCEFSSTRQINFLADSESLVAKSFFHAQLPEHDQTTEVLAKLTAAMLQVRPTEPLPDAILAKCVEIRDYIDKREAQFVSDVQANVVRAMNPDCAEWKPFAQNTTRQGVILSLIQSELMLELIAGGLIIRAASQVGRIVDPDEIRKMSWELLKIASPPIRLYREILQRIAEAGCDVSRPERANWIWDMQIAYAIGGDLGGPSGAVESLLLVTSDAAIIRSGVAAGMERNVLSLDDYLAFLERGPDQTTRHAVGKPPMITGDNAFKLHDTYGFPIDLTRIMAEERGMTVDIAGYEKLMEQARELARAGGKEGESRLFELPPDALAELQKSGVAPTDDSYKFNAAPIGATIKAIWDGHRLIPHTHGAEENSQGFAVVLDRTCFYAEMGGQVGDAGELRSPSGAVMAVKATRSAGGYVLHVGNLEAGHLSVGDHVTATLAGVRPRTEKNHTATHLANWALREVLGEGVQQKGSLVDPDKLRFDFSHGQSLADEQLGRVEQLVNENISKKLPVYAENAPQEQALKINGLRAVFGEKYPPMVRVVSIGAPVADLLKDPANPKWREFSVEFCGGTHLKNATDAGAFAITAEESVSKGIRRIVALTGDAAREVVARGEAIDKQTAAAKGKPDADLPGVVADLQKAIAAADLSLRTRRRAQGVIAELQDRFKKWEKANRAQSASKIDIGEISTRLLADAPALGPGKLIVGEVPGATPEQLLSVTDSLKKKSGSYAILLGSATDGKVSFVAAVSDDLIALGLKAGDWIRQAAQTTGGGGGGRPQMAQAGGKDPSKLPEALKLTEDHARRSLAGE